MIKSGEITQWRKYPTFFFVKDVKKARIHLKNGKLYHRYLNPFDIPASEKFLKIYCELREKLKDGE